MAERVSVDDETHRTITALKRDEETVAEVVARLVDAHTEPKREGVGNQAASEESGVRMTVSLQDADTVREVLLCLARSVGTERFSVDCVAKEDSGPCLIPVDHLTEGQFVTAEAAVECGYYDEPKRGQLSDIVAELDCSESAVSQRLGTVERKLVRSLADSRSCQPPVSASSESDGNRRHH
jgi:predicted DNA binding protein